MGLMSTVTKLLLFSLLLLAGSAALPGQTADGTVGSPAPEQLERAIREDRSWLADADRLMDELNTIDIQLHTRLARVSSDESRNLVVRERNNIRRLMVELTAARNLVYSRLNGNLELYHGLGLAPAAGTPTR